MAIRNIEYVVINPDMPSSTVNQPTQFYVPRAGSNIYGTITMEMLNTKQDKITDTDKISADLVDDNTSINKFVTDVQRSQIKINADNIINLQIDVTTLQEEVTTVQRDITNITERITNAYCFAGSKTVAQLNALAVNSNMNGNVYNVTDEGVLVHGDVAVSVGDNIAIVWDNTNGTYTWDKLSGALAIDRDALTNTTTDVAYIMGETI